MTSVCFVVGARPNFVKAAPVVRALARAAPELDLFVVHTEQHYDRTMSDVFFDALSFPPPAVSLGVRSGSHAEQTARALVGVEEALTTRRPQLVVVSGDVNSTLAGALAAVKLQIPVAHIEAGLRSFDPRMPEEHNRRLTDHLSELLLVHSNSAIDNLAREGIAGEHVHFVGNTMIDSLLEHLDRALELQPWSAVGVEADRYGLVTLHRPALVDDSRLLAQTVAELIALSAEWPLVFPVHPRTLEQLRTQSLDHAFANANVVLTEPLGYDEFLGLEARARFVLTDSGGVQEETSALGVRCFTLREATERPVTVELGTNVVLGSRPDRMAQIPALLAQPVPGETIPGWDGRAGERAAAVVSAWLAAHP